MHVLVGGAWQALYWPAYAEYIPAQGHLRMPACPNKSDDGVYYHLLSLPLVGNAGSQARSLPSDDNSFSLTTPRKFHLMAYAEYSVEDEILTFFAKTSACRSDCDARAEELVGGRATTLDVQGNCSYTVYAGPCLEYVVQFRLKSLQLDLRTASLARHVYGCYAPTVSFEGYLGDESKEKEPLYVYVMDRIKGVTHLDFILAHGYPDNSPENFARRQRLMIDVAR